jgi:hypothetical protein
MNLPGQTKPLTGVKPELLATSIKLKKLNISSGSITWFIFVLIILLELYTLYTTLYQNITFATQTPQELGAAAVRVNDEKYEQVIKRLENISIYRPETDIDYTGIEPGIGRSNPFQDPE